MLWGNRFGSHLAAKKQQQYVPEISVTAGPFTALPPRDQEAEVGGGSRKSSQRETEEQVYG